MSKEIYSPNYKTTAYFMAIATAVSEKSKDPSSRVGCVLVDDNGRIVSTGYNGFVAGCNEAMMSFERPLKYHLTIHAEENALLFARRPLEGCVAYITHGPCDTCLKHLLQAGVRTVIYSDPSIMKERGTADQKDAIRRLVSSVPCVVRNWSGEKYTEELRES